jgi:hypothetical protein
MCIVILSSLFCALTSLCHVQVGIQPSRSVPGVVLNQRERERDDFEATRQA